MTYAAVAKILGWHERTTVKDSLKAAETYVRNDLRGEVVLTVGGPVHEWREGVIDGVVSVGPLECMPNKISEAQLFHVTENEGLPALTLALNGDPVDPEIIDNFAFEVHQRFRASEQPQQPSIAARAPAKTPVGPLPAKDGGRRAPLEPTPASQPLQGTTTDSGHGLDDITLSGLRGR